MSTSDLQREQLGLRQWYQTQLGSAVLAAEQAELNVILQDLFGFHLLQVGIPTEASLLTGSRIRHQVQIHPGPSTGGEGDLFAEPQALPIASDSVDVALLPHTLEFSSAPHQVLREIERILIPEGHVVIVAFNPWSLWGVWRLVRSRQADVPWGGRFLGLTRIKDWLALLGFDTVVVRHAVFRPPLQQEGVMRRLQFLERFGRRWWPILAGVNFIVAKKRVATLTPLKPRWRPRRGLVPGRVPKPAIGAGG